MPTQVTASSSPDEIVKNAAEYVSMLKTSGLPADPVKIEADMRKKAASLQSPPMTVPEWEDMWDKKNGAAAAPPPPTAAPKAKPKPRGAVTRDKDYFYVTPGNASDAATWFELNQGGDRVHMLLVGPSGCGKTSLFGEIGKKYAKPVYKVDAAAITSIDRWLGHKDVRITKDGPETTYVLSEFLRWISADGYEPGIVAIDEINRVPPQVSNILMSIFDGSESIWVPELGVTIKVHPETMFGATANIGVGFSGTYALDQALQDRFGMTLEVTWPEQSEEIKILETRVGVDPDEAKKLVRIATDVRNKPNEFQKPVSTRMLLNASLLVAKGRSVIDACEATFIKHYSSDGGVTSERAKIQLILKGVAGK